MKITIAFLPFSRPDGAGSGVISAFLRSGSRLLLILVILVLAIGFTACRNDDSQDLNEGQQAPDLNLADPTLAVSGDAEVRPTSTTQPSPTVRSSPPSPVVSPVLVESPTEAPVMASEDLSIRPSEIGFYPDGAVYEGDLVSIRIDPRIPDRLAPNDIDVRIFIDGVQVVSNNVNWRSLNGNPYGLYQWVWDSSDNPGNHTVIVFLDPEDALFSGDESSANNIASTKLEVQPAEYLSDAELNARWVTEENGCCRIHVVSGTAAHRDLDSLLVQVDAAYQKAADILGEQLRGQYDVYLVDRIFGQGGYAKESMVVSYPDRDYIAGELEELLVHEAVHLIDRRFSSNPITFLSEGLAVWAAGGHYEQQDLSQRMSALVQIGHYEALDQIINDFVGTQHEVGYLEGAGFIDYLVDTYGWDLVKTFYGQTSANDGETLTEAVDVNMRRVFSKPLEQIESEWIAHLRNAPRDKDAMDNLRATLRYYDLVRRYQADFDPAAYYLTTWLPDPEIALLQGATADFSRQRTSPINVALETMLVSAGSSFRQSEYEKAYALMDSVERVLNNNGAFLDPLALSYLDIVLTARDMGFEALEIELLGDQATVLVSQPEEIQLALIDLALGEGRHWTMTR
ncbi:MAG TPA: hypothetical protein VFI27_08015 [candidate division Zixibacteria bacterium]|nr:hypothetical protein [candidate division Zixibacteria bacterium]